MNSVLGYYAFPHLPLDELRATFLWLPVTDKAEFRQEFFRAAVSLQEEWLLEKYLQAGVPNSLIKTELMKALNASLRYSSRMILEYLLLRTGPYHQTDINTLTSFVSSHHKKETSLLMIVRDFPIDTPFSLVMLYCNSIKALDSVTPLDNEESQVLFEYALAHYERICCFHKFVHIEEVREVCQDFVKLALLLDADLYSRFLLQTLKTCFNKHSYVETVFLFTGLYMQSLPEKLKLASSKMLVEESMAYFNGEQFGVHNPPKAYFTIFAGELIATLPESSIEALLEAIDESLIRNCASNSNLLTVEDSIMVSIRIQYQQQYKSLHAWILEALLMKKPIATQSSLRKNSMFLDFHKFMPNSPVTDEKNEAKHNLLSPTEQPRSRFRSQP